MKIVDFLVEKLVKMLWFWSFYLLTTLISREKLSKKIWVKNSGKCWGFVKIEFLDKNLTFRIVCAFAFAVKMTLKFLLVELRWQLSQL